MPLHFLVPICVSLVVLVTGIVLVALGSRMPAMTARIFAIVHFIAGIQLGILFVVPFIPFFSLAATLGAWVIISGIGIGLLKLGSVRTALISHGLPLVFSLLIAMAVVAGVIRLPSVIGALCLWLVILGIRIGVLRTGVYKAALITHRLLFVWALLLSASGVYGLYQEELSARRGGGLLGGMELIPLTLGMILAAASIPMLVWLKNEAVRVLLSGGR